jgi:hypothetical protein
MFAVRCWKHHDAFEQLYRREWTKYQKTKTCVMFNDEFDFCGMVTE